MGNLVGPNPDVGNHTLGVLRWSLLAVPALTLLLLFSGAMTSIWLYSGFAAIWLVAVTTAFAAHAQSLPDNADARRRIAVLGLAVVPGLVITIALGGLALIVGVGGLGLPVSVAALLIVWVPGVITVIVRQVKDPGSSTTELEGR